MLEERHQKVLEELRNICKNGPLFPGDTLSHATAEECVRRGWATRGEDGHFVATIAGGAHCSSPAIQELLRDTALAPIQSRFDKPVGALPAGPQATFATLDGSYKEPSDVVGTAVGRCKGVTVVYPLSKTDHPLQPGLHRWRLEVDMDFDETWAAPTICDCVGDHLNEGEHFDRAWIVSARPILGPEEKP